MFLLELIEDLHYEGTYTTSLCVSKSNKKIEKIIDLLKKEATEMKKIWEQKEIELEEKYSPLRENQHRRTQKEMEERQEEFKNIEKKFKYIFKFKLHYVIILNGTTSFNIKKIDVV